MAASQEGDAQSRHLTIETGTETIMYNSVRQDNDTLDSSPFPIVLQLSAELWAELEGTMSRHPSAPALAIEDTCRRMAQIVSNLVHCEVVFPDGRQVTLYTRDVPHAVPIPPLEVYPLQATRDRRVSLTVQRSLPLSSAHGNSEFRLAILFNAPRSGAIVLYTGVFRVLAKMGRRGTRPKQQHFASYTQLPLERARKVLLLQALSGEHRHELERSLDRPQAIAVRPDLLDRCMRETLPKAPGPGSEAWADGVIVAGAAPRERRDEVGIAMSGNPLLPLALASAEEGDDDAEDDDEEGGGGRRSRQPGGGAGRGGTRGGRRRAEWNPPPRAPPVQGLQGQRLPGQPHGQLQWANVGPRVGGDAAAAAAAAATASAAASAAAPSAGARLGGGGSASSLATLTAVAGAASDAVTAALAVGGGAGTVGTAAAAAAASGGGRGGGVVGSAAGGRRGSGGAPVHGPPDDEPVSASAAAAAAAASAGHKRRRAAGEPLFSGSAVGAPPMQLQRQVAPLRRGQPAAAPHPPPAAAAGAARPTAESIDESLLMPPPSLGDLRVGLSIASLLNAADAASLPPPTPRQAPTRAPAPAPAPLPGQHPTPMERLHSFSGPPPSLSLAGFGGTSSTDGFGLLGGGARRGGLRARNGSGGLPLVPSLGGEGGAALGPPDSGLLQLMTGPSSDSLGGGRGGGRRAFKGGDDDYEDDESGMGGGGGTSGLPPPPPPPASLGLRRGSSVISVMSDSGLGSSDGTAGGGRQAARWSSPQLPPTGIFALGGRSGILSSNSLIAGGAHPLLGRTASGLSAGLGPDEEGGAGELSGALLLGSAAGRVRHRSGR